LRVPVTSSMDIFDRSANASIETKSCLYLEQTTRRYFLSAFSSDFGSPRSARHCRTPLNRSAKSSIASSQSSLIVSYSVRSV
jgi:hypothetical protein